MVGVCQRHDLFQSMVILGIFVHSAASYFMRYSVTRQKVFCIHGSFDSSEKKNIITTKTFLQLLLELKNRSRILESSQVG